MKLVMDERLKHRLIGLAVIIIIGCYFCSRRDEEIKSTS